MKKFIPLGLIMLMITFIFGFTSQEFPTFNVQHHINGNQVMVECVVTGISFRELDHKREKVGKMVLWVDGEKHLEVKTAAFIIKDLSPGSHKLKLEVVKLNNEPYGLAEEFVVNIPK